MKKRRINMSNKIPLTLKDYCRRNKAMEDGQLKGLKDDIVTLAYHSGRYDVYNEILNMIDILGDK